MQTNRFEWKDTEEECIAWIAEGITRLREELECCQEHWQRCQEADARVDLDEVSHELYRLNSHLNNVHGGILAILGTLIQRFSPPYVVAQLAADKIEEQTGKIVVLHNGFDGSDGENIIEGFMFELIDPEDAVPDDLSGLEDC